SDVFRDRGWTEDDPAARRFSQKIRAGEMIGFNTSPNTLAAITITLAIVAMGYCIQRVRWREYAWIVVPAIGLVAAAGLLRYTQSKTALATPVIAAGLLVLIALARGWMSRHRVLVFSLGIAAFLLGVLAVVGHGLYH